MINLIILQFFIALPSHAAPTVERFQFQPFQSYIWGYSELDPTTQLWKAPYLYEQYTIIEVHGDLVTIEMASSNILPITTRAHHKFTFDISNCLNHQNFWTLEFYTKSLSPDWELVSDKHKNLAFTEKFNCSPSFKNEQTQKSGAFNIVSGDEVANLTWYIQDGGPFYGVAFEKYFDETYRFQLITK